MEDESPYDDKPDQELFETSYIFSSKETSPSKKLSLLKTNLQVFLSFISNKDEAYSLKKGHYQQVYNILMFTIVNINFKKL